MIAWWITGADLSGLEIAANAIMAGSIWLAARNSVHTWPTGVIGCALFWLVFFRNQLYADAALQVFFIATSLIGWWQWFHPAARSSSGERPITVAKSSTIARVLFAAVGVTELVVTLVGADPQLTADALRGFL